MLGTPLYMAPEQAECRHDAIGPWTDVYSLGIILYELLAGRPPFTGASLVTVLNELRTVEPTRLRSQRPEIPRDLERVCLKCLAKDPVERYPTAEALAADLERFLSGGKVKAHPLSTL